MEEESHPDAMEVEEQEPDEIAQQEPQASLNLLKT